MILNSVLISPISILAHNTKENEPSFKNIKVKSFQISIREALVQKLEGGGEGV